MNTNYWVHLRDLLGALLLFILVSAALSCASHPETTPDLAAAGGPASEVSAEARRVPESDPFEVARVWALSATGATRGAEALSPGVRSLVSSWAEAQVARVWAAGDEYRALIIEKSTTGAKPAVLLYISADPSGAWQVTAAKPSSSTALWSEF